MLIRSRPRAALFTLALASACPTPGLAQAQGDQRAPSELRQSAAVLARFADVPGMRLDSPWFTTGRQRAFTPGAEAAGFTTQAEMEAFIANLGNATNLARGSIGRSRQGRAIPFLLFTAEGVRDFEAARALGRPVVWLIGQHHGNEPAGGEALLALSRALATGGELAEVTRQVTVVVIPRSNPDGAAAFTRDTADGMDPNRDHLLLTLPETRALHAAAGRLPPDLVIDAHETAVGGRWITKFGGLLAPDFVFMRATHPLVPRQATELAEELFLPAIAAASTAAGLSSYIYQTTPNERPEDKTVATGGNAAGIARNTFGLGGAVSILLETRGIGIGAQSFQRRVATHYLAVSAALRAAAAEPQRLARAVAEGRRAAMASREPLVVAHRIPVMPGFAPLLDPETAAPRPVSVPFMDARRIEPTVQRPRPSGYVLQGQALALGEELASRGVATCALTASAEVEAEAFTVTERAAVDRRAINPEGGLRTGATRERARLPVDALFVPVAQPAAGLVVAALDPDAPGSFVSAGMLPGEVGARLPLLRLPEGAFLPAGLLRPLEPSAAAACGG